MKTFNRALALIALLLFLCAPACAGSSVWKVSREGNHLYLGGTIHFLAAEDYPLPASFDTAYHDAAILVFETDLNKARSPEFQQSVMVQGIYAGQDTIEHHLRPDTLKALEKYLDEHGVPLTLVSKLKPGMMSVMLQTIELQRLGMSGTGVDEFYYNRATEDGIDVNQLETVDEQLSFLVNMGQGQEDELINYTLNDLKNMATSIASLKTVWRNGDAEGIDRLAVKPMATKFPALYQTLVVNRNNNWLPKIEAMLRTHDVGFVLVGAAHLVGSEGLLAKLKSRGYLISKL